ncbi:unnamed protein product [Rotaria sordida]|uniref:FZ domain-containing protein n=1 Tax=Rotaria sordida TaxID=392033 RepID=A0A813NEW7_9BILA|nr:unnamed protein product [Rotaria sordida]CAF1177972.1 unnamed protein product [Rotaria sordida]
MDPLNDRKGTSASDRKTQVDDTNNDKNEQSEENYPRTSPNRRNRYSSYGSLLTNYRARARRPSSYEDMNSNDWSPYEHGLNNLISNFPGLSSSPGGAFDSNAYVKNEPTCYRLLDPQYPLFSDLCGAVPQARYSLPNSFGHLERWQITQVLSTMLGSTPPTSPNPACTRSLRLLICPLLFPPCPSQYEPPPVLPCQPFCRVVKSQCSAPSLDLLPCDFLPPTSNLCPVNPSPYSSLLSSYAQPMSLNSGAASSTMPQSPLSSYLAQSAISLALSQPAYSSPMSPSGAPQSGMPPGLSPSSAPQSAVHSVLSPSFVNPSSRSFAMPVPFAQQFNTQPYMIDTLTPVLVDFPPLSYAHFNRPAARFFPAMRSASEKAT